MRSGVETRRFEFVADFTELEFDRGIAPLLQQPIDRVHPEADRFHVERRHGAPEGLSGLQQLFAIGGRGHGLEHRQELVQLCQG